VARTAFFLIVVLFYILYVLYRSMCVSVCKCVLYYSHRVATQLQLTNISYIISYHIISYHIISHQKPKEKGGAGFEARTGFMARDVSENTSAFRTLGDFCSV